MSKDIDNIKRVVEDIRYLIATDCCDETIQARIENYIAEKQNKELRDRLQAVKDSLMSDEQILKECTFIEDGIETIDSDAIYGINLQKEKIVKSLNK